jgi:pilus assembly protein CpaE
MDAFEPHASSNSYPSAAIPVTVLVDANVAYGDCAAFLRVRPQRTLMELASIPGDFDESALKSVLTAHESGLQLVCAGTDPLAAESLDTGLVTRLLNALRQQFDLVVVDTSSNFDAFSQAVLADCDLAYLVTSIELPAIKDARVCLSTFDRLGLATDKIRVVLNRANSKVGFPPEEVDRALGHKIAAKLPSHISVPRAINSGVIVSLDNPRSPVARALDRMASSMNQELFSNGHKKTRKLALRKESGS